MTNVGDGRVTQPAVTTVAADRAGSPSADQRTVQTERSLDPSRSVPFLCVPQLLEHQAKRIPDAPAILAPGRAPLTYGRLYRHVEEMQVKLRAIGIGRHDRVVLVLPNGPEMALAFITVAASAVCAPLHPAYGAEELERCFADLRPSAVITQTGVDTAARIAARSHNIPIIELSIAGNGEAGLFTLTGRCGPARSSEAVDPRNVALLLPTSGTTSRPKLVPLTHFNICTSAYASVAAKALGETDRCLNLLPLFYGLGLNGTVLASLAAGASVICTPGCDVAKFSAWLTEFQPTWCAAVPTMLQAILGHARLTGERVGDRSLRFIRTATAPLPRSVLTEVERLFEAPLINFYGMTETASAPIAMSPLPPRRRKPGSVGVPVWLDVAIMGDEGALLPRGETGQVVVRGPSVMSGYEGAPLANQAAFAGGWFKTGDNGFFDDDGYLFLVGRSQEFINRGGEKIAPQEIDEVLLEHPAVAEAVTFGVPHPTLGEEVAAAVVLRPDAVATPKDIRQFAVGRIADFKIPRQVLMASELPKGPTGKIQRIGLAAKLGFASHGSVRQPYVAPCTPIEKVLAGIWAEVLQVERVGVNDDFFALGGDSLLATRFLIHLYETMKIEVEISRLFDASTVKQLARHIETLRQAGQADGVPLGIVRVPRENGVAPASFAQEKLWELQQALPDIPFFNILYALRVTSALNAVALERCINEIVRRHESLRTTFTLVDGRLMQVIAPQLTVPLALHDLRALLPAEKENSGHEQIHDELVHSFDLENGPLIRTSLARMDDRDHLLVVSMHQTICDGWSLRVFVDELLALYDAFTDGRESPLPPLSIQYADFAQWQRDWPLRPETVAQLEYWKQQLREPMPVMRFAKSDAQPTVEDLRTVRRNWALPPSLAEAAKRFSHEEGGTLFMALVAALQTLLHHYLGQYDIRVITNVANRHRHGTQGLIGHLVNSVTLRTDLGGNPTAREVLRRVRATTLAAFARADFPFEELVATLERERLGQALPLSNVMILLENPTLRPAASGDHKLGFEEANPNMLMPLVTITSFEVILMLRESVDGLAGTCVYKPHVFGADTIYRLLRDFQEVLERMATQPDRPISAIRVLLNE